MSCGKDHFEPISSKHNPNWPDPHPDYLAQFEHPHPAPVEACPERDESCSRRGRRSSPTEPAEGSEPALAPKARHPNWGGPRPGAGAPRGNLNNFKHGRYSARQKDILRLIDSIPELAEPLEKIARRKRRAAKQTREGASLILEKILERIGEVVLVSNVAAHPAERGSSVSSGSDNHLEFNRELAAQLETLRALLREIPKT